MPKTKPVLLVVLDGWGIRMEREANAIAIAGTPNMDALAKEFPATALQTSGLSVGLPEGQMGNSEVGHTNLGAGRIVYQDLVRVNRAIEDGSFFQLPALVEAVRKARSAGGAVHFMGLVSDGGVHSHQNHLYALLSMAARRGVKDVVVHAFLDGRDVPPESGLEYVRKLEREIHGLGSSARVATVMGRYYAMDRDNRWDRTERAYRAMVRGEGRQSGDPVAAVRESYADVRELLVHFRTRVGEGDIEHGVRTLLARFEHQTGIATELSTSGSAIPLAPDDQFRIGATTLIAPSNP